MTPEGAVKKKIKDILQTRGAYYTMPIGNGYGASGVPDFVICYKGRFIGVEAKANGNKPTALQDKHMSAIRGAGGLTLVIDETNIDELTQLLEKL
jgi:pantoate kinase